MSTSPKEIHNIRTPPTSDFRSYEWNLPLNSLPKFPTIETYEELAAQNQESDDIVIKVKRPRETPCPAPPEELKEWISGSWNNLNGEVEFLEAKNIFEEDKIVKTELFEDSTQRVQQKESWMQKRAEWITAEKPVRNALKVFSHLFELHAKLKKEDEKFQLHFTDGQLDWSSEKESVSHPILLQKVSLEFDPEEPCFYVILEPDEELRLASHVLRFHGISGNVINEIKDIVANADYSLKESSKIRDILNRFIHSAFQNGKLVEAADPLINDSSTPTIHPNPMLLLTKKSQSITEVLEKLIENMDEDSKQPPVLQRIVGIDKNTNDGESASASEAFSTLPVDDDFEFFQTKPANEEQIRIVRRLENSGCVLVQGPPGTGKSHTIANLIGHLLAKGKRILVTSQTSKALKVVREKVVSPLQPLCVANLSNDSESKAQLKESINGIVNYISKTDFGKISKQIDSLKSKRDALKENLKNLEAQALKIRRSEYTDIVIAGETSINPTEAAKYIQNHQEENSWIPSPIKQGSPLPVTTEELQVIYKANGLYSSTEEKCLDDGMLELSQLPTPQEIQEISNLKQEVSKNTDKSFLEHFEKSDAINEPNFEEFIDQFESTLNSILKDDWSKRVFKKLVIDPNRLSPWEELLELIELTYKNITANENIIFSKNPKVNFEWTDEIYQSCVNLSGHLSAKGKVSWASVLFNRSWKMILENSTVDGKRPEKAEDIRAISLIYENKIARERLIERWHRQMVANGSSPLDDSEPELQARTFLKQLETIVSWHNTVWDEAIEYFESIGFKLNQALEAKNIDLRASSDELLEFLISTVIPSLKHKRNSLKLKRIDKQIDQFLKILEHKEFSENSKAFYINDLKYSIENLDHAIYKESYKKLERLAALSETHKLRNGILLKLKEYAPKWANLIKERMSPHNINAIPGDPLVAWKVRQYIQELDDRHKEDYNEVQKRLDLTKRQLDSVNAEYVEALSWRYQLKRTGLEQKQNLIGWQQLQEKITKTGRGKMDSKRKRESRGLLKKCKDSVPVWIMPLSKVYESFDFKGNDFDVLILDEASQSDITAIIALGIAKEVIIVGDKEQVTPQGIGQDLTQIQSLIDEYLEGIPNKMSYDGKTSIYDIAEQSFGETIRLVEHFRCVPEIIHFSNYLSYNGEIKPLREKSDGHFKQSLVEHRVFGKRADNGKVNKIEAQEIASLVTAMTKDPSYSNLSIGVISLLGSHQTTAIDTLLQTHLPPSVYEKHNILCGDSANFQGDERDVIFLSMIDSCDKPPLRIVQSDTYKKRYNVAASRAKDQLWVVHSLNYDTDLQSGDLRQRLISHIRNPHSTAEKISSANELADSDFEKRVQKDLITRGYHITPQWEVGSFRIDIVVHCGDKRMAIECDGDKHHTDENLADDINRQGILERLGWKFIRIRGSEYYRHPEKTIEKVISTLNDNDIEPEDSSSAEGPTDNDNTIRDLHLKAEKIRSEWGGSSELLNEIEIDSSSLEDEEDEDKDPPQKNKSSNSNSKDHVENSNAFSKLSIETQTNQVRHLKIGSEEELESGDSIDSQVAIKIEPPSSTVRDDILKKYTDDDHLITEELDGTEAEPSPNSIVNMQGGSNRESSMPAEMLTIERARNKVSGPGDECWFKISKNTELQKFQKSQAYNVGKFIKSERDLSEKLTYWAVKIIYDLVKSGAKTDSWSHSTFGLKMIEMELFLEYYNPKDLS